MGGNLITRETPRTAPCHVLCRADGDQVSALIGNDIQTGLCGFGDTLADALRDLAFQIDKEVGVFNRFPNPWGGAKCEAESAKRYT